jgi:cobalt-precorrin-7 (C5)-methyltransferase
MPEISVLGLGPGHPDYILPVARREIERADILVGGERSLRDLDKRGKETFVVRDNLPDVARFIRAHYERSMIAVIVSGDPGLYSILRFLRKHFKAEELRVIPGISSLQYMYSKLGLPWENACFASLHGRNEDFVDQVRRCSKVGLFTDSRWPPEKIARSLMQHGISDRLIFVGEHLSYETEKITRGTVAQIAASGGYSMAVVVIMDEHEMDL